MSIVIITDIKRINAAVKAIKTAGAKFEAQLHSVAYSCLAHAANTGDIRPMGDLYAALSGRVLKTALVAWGNAFGRLTMIEPQADGEAFSIAYTKAKVADLESAAMIPVSDYKPAATEGAGALFDLAKKLAQTVKGATKEGVTLTDDERKALVLVTQALALLDPTVVPASNVVPIKTPKSPRKAKVAPDQLAA